MRVRPGGSLASSHPLSPDTPPFGRSGTIRVHRSLYRGTFVDPKSARSIRTIGM